MNTLNEELEKIEMEYKNILKNDEISQIQLNLKLSELMTKMENLYHIPALNDTQYNKEHRTIMTLYLMIANSRNFSNDYYK